MHTQGLTLQGHWYVSRDFLKAHRLWTHAVFCISFSTIKASPAIPFKNMLPLSVIFSSSFMLNLKKLATMMCLEKNFVIQLYSTCGHRFLQPMIACISRKCTSGQLMNFFLKRKPTPSLILLMEKQPRDTERWVSVALYQPHCILCSTD